MIRNKLLFVLALVVFFALVGPSSTRAHEAHMLIGRSSFGQLEYHPADGVRDEALIVLALIPPGGPIEGYSASIPGFSLVLTPSVEDDCYPLEAGADVWLELVAVDVPMLMIETPSYRIINEQEPPEMRIGGDATAHVHPLWLLDTTDPAFDPCHCIWEVHFFLKDKGTTGYSDSELLTFRFSAGRVPIPADLDCDQDVDLDDFGIFQACRTGSAQPYDLNNLPQGCTLEPDGLGIIGADLDRDLDVDQSDYGVFQRCYSGPDVPGDPNCAE